VELSLLVPALERQLPEEMLPPASVEILYFRLRT
jgi:hypothetical protein